MYGTFALLDEGGKIQEGERIFLGEVKGKNEAWLRDTLFLNPKIIPIDDIDSTFGPLVPLCKELRTDVGSIDAVFINERGRLTIVECKLWKNPQSRREVVAQTLDYVSALGSWSYADLQRQVAAALGKQGNMPFELVRQRTDGRIRESEFVDTVSRTLRDGRFLVLLAGDGIREGVQSLTELVNRTATKAFTFGLLEVAVYRFGKDRFAIQPRLLAETELITRQITMVNARGADAKFEEQIDDEEDDGKGSGKDHLKKWWQPLLNMKFDDPEQEAPFWVGTNNLVLKTPFPGVRIKAASSTTQDNVVVFVSGRNVDAIRPFVRRDRRYLLDNLPKDSIVHHQDDWPVLCANRSSLSNADKYVWLKATLNSFVNALRPRLRGWYAEAQKP
jgi:hypothetical protein